MKSGVDLNQVFVKFPLLNAASDLLEKTGKTVVEERPEDWG